MILVIDNYDGDNEVIGRAASEAEAIQIARQRCYDTDDECCIRFFKDGNEVNPRW